MLSSGQLTFGLTSPKGLEAAKRARLLFGFASFRPASEILALQAERKAFEMRKGQKPEALPPLIKTFWEHLNFLIKTQAAPMAQLKQ